MMLQRFFNLTEMKVGFTDPAQVTELIDVLQTERDCVYKNVRDATRGWSTVSRTILSTENRNCLDLFIQLDGLCIIHRWLEDVQNFADETGGVFVEESIIAMLRAVEKLHPDREKSLSSRIWISVKNLIGHKSYIVQDLARSLFDSWTQCGNDDNITQAVEKVYKPLDNVIERSVLHECSTMDVSLSKESCIAGNHSFKGAHDHIIPSRGSNDFCLERIEEDSQVEKTNSQRNLDGAQVPISMGASPEQKKHDNLEGISEISPKSNDVSSDANQKCEIKSHENGITETHISFPGTVDLDLKSDAILKPEANFKSQNDLDSKDYNHCSSIDDGNIITDPNIMMNNCTTVSLESSDGSRESCSSASQDSFASDHVFGENEDQVIEVNSFKEVSSVGGEDLLKTSNNSISTSNGRDFGSADMQQLEYGIVDALEVARKVAEEVAMQNPDSSCTISSEKSSNSIDGKGDQFPNQTPSEQNKSPPINEKNSVPDNFYKFEVPQEQEPEVNNSERGLCDFDLNQDVSPEPDELLVPKVLRDENICIGFDLNSVAEGVENNGVELSSSGESCVEVSPKGLGLDLNRTWDERPEEQGVEGISFPIHSSNGYLRTPSPASSSSSIRPAIDLNGPYLFNESDYRGADDVGFSFTGYPYAYHPSFDGGFSYGYGLNNGGRPSCISFSTMFGGSGMGMGGIPFVTPPPPPQPQLSESYFVNLGRPAEGPPKLPLGLTLVGSQSFDLNLNSEFKSGGNEDMGLGLSIGQKRKQPEGGMWELFPFPNKIQQRPWR